jgi:hypothetical protein
MGFFVLSRIIFAPLLVERRNQQLAKKVVVSNEVNLT